MKRLSDRRTRIQKVKGYINHRHNYDNDKSDNGDFGTNKYKEHNNK